MRFLLGGKSLRFEWSYHRLLKTFYIQKILD
ncbi:hypothetical protein EMIT0P2_10067 [Pseudomonas sp. IT-P2]